MDYLADVKGYALSRKAEVLSKPGVKHLLVLLHGLEGVRYRSGHILAYGVLESLSGFLIELRQFSCEPFKLSSEVKAVNHSLGYVREE